MKASLQSLTSKLDNDERSFAANSDRYRRLTILTMPRGQVQTDIWGSDHPDTGLTLKYLHTCKQQGVRPNLAAFKETADGVHLVSKHKSKKVQYNYAQTEKRYRQYLTNGGGNFTDEQLATAGLQIPATNSARVGGQDIIPGGGDNNTAGADEAVLLGRDDRDEFEEVPPAADPPPDVQVDVNEAQENLSRLGLNSPASSNRVTPNEGVWEWTDAANMTHRKGLIRVPQMRHGDSAKTLFVLMHDAPGGVTLKDLSAVMGVDCETVTITYFDLSEAYDAVTLCEGMHDNVSLALSDAVQDELDDPDNTTTRDGNRVKKTIEWQLPEVAERYLFNPVTQDQEQPIYEKVITGGRRVFFTAAYARRSDPLHQPLTRTNRSREEQLQEILQSYPEFRGILGHVEVLPRQAPAPRRRAPTPLTIDTAMVDVGPPPPPVVAPAPPPPAPVAPPRDNNMGQMLAALNQRMAEQQTLFERRLADQLAQQQQRFDQTTSQIEAAYRQRLGQERTAGRLDTERVIAGLSPRVLQVLQGMDRNTLAGLTAQECNSLLGRFFNEAQGQNPGAAAAGGPPVVQATVDGGTGANTRANSSLPVAQEVVGAPGTRPTVVTVSDDGDTASTTQDDSM